MLGHDASPDQSRPGSLSLPAEAKGRETESQKLLHRQERLRRLLGCCPDIRKTLRLKARLLKAPKKPQLQRFEDLGNYLLCFLDLANLASGKWFVWKIMHESIPRGGATPEPISAAAPHGNGQVEWRQIGETGKAEWGRTN